MIKGILTGMLLLATSAYAEPFEIESAKVGAGIGAHCAISITADRFDELKEDKVTSDQVVEEINDCIKMELLKFRMIQEAERIRNEH